MLWWDEKWEKCGGKKRRLSKGKERKGKEWRGEEVESIRDKTHYK